MKNKITTTLHNQEWYQHWREIANAIIYQTLRNSRVALIEGKWKLGEHIEVHIKDFNRSQTYGERISEKISDDLGISKREVNRCRQFYRFCIREFKAKDWDRVGPNLPEEKQISWNQIKTKWLPQPKEDKIELPKGKYQVIYADPPWQFNNEGFDQSAEQKYPTMPVEKICSIKVQEKIGEKAVLFLWITNAFLEEGLKVCKDWGFTYKTNFVWIKKKGPTIGWFSKSRHELLFIATKGEGMHPKEKLNSWFEAEVTKHSKKPEIVYEFIERMYDGPYLELFARNLRKNWASWGNELSN